jgi:hypothetical protein
MLAGQNSDAQLVSAFAGSARSRSEIQNEQPPEQPLLSGAKVHQGGGATDS